MQRHSLLMTQILSKLLYLNSLSSKAEADNGKLPLALKTQAGHHKSVEI